MLLSLVLPMFVSFDPLRSGPRWKKSHHLACMKPVVNNGMISISTGEFTGFLNHQQEIREVDSSGSWRGVALLLLGTSTMKMTKVLRLKEGLRRGPGVGIHLFRGS